MPRRTNSTSLPSSLHELQDPLLNETPSNSPPPPSRTSRPVASACSRADDRTQPQPHTMPSRTASSPTPDSFGTIHVLPLHNAPRPLAPAPSRSSRLVASACLRAADKSIAPVLGLVGASWTLGGAVRGWPRRWLRPDVHAFALWRAERRHPIDWDSAASLCALCFTLLLLSAWLAHAHARDKARARGSSAELDRAGWMSKLNFWWVMGTLRAARERDALEMEHLPRVACADEPERLFARFRRRWASSGAWRLLGLVLCSVQPRVFWTALATTWLVMLSTMVDPFVLQRVLHAAQAQDLRTAAQPGVARGEVLAVLMLGANMLVRVTFGEFCYFYSVRAATNARSALVVALFRAALRAPDPAELARLAARAEGAAAPDKDGKESGSVSGRLTNLMATDADKVGKSPDLVFCMACWLWAVFTLPIVLWQLHTLMGSAAIVGVCTLLLSNLLSWLVARVSQTVSRALQTRRDARGALLAELLSGVRLIKLSGSEGTWAQRLTCARDEELRQLALTRYLRMLSEMIGYTFGIGVPASVFGWYTLAQRRVLTPTVAFTALSWIFQMRWSISILPHLVEMVSSLLPSLERLARAFTALDGLPGARGFGGHARAPASAARGSHGVQAAAHCGASATHGAAERSSGTCEAEEAGGEEESDQGELPPAGVAAELIDAVVLHGGGDGDEPARELTGPDAARTAVDAAADADDDVEAARPRACAAGARAPASDGEPTPRAHAVAAAPAHDGGSRVVFASVSIAARAAELLLLCGPVGSGKSSLLEALARARPLGGGVCRAVRRRAYVSQKPFLLSGTIRANILFGLRFDAERYADAVARAQLQPELRALPAADETAVGEKGVQLSGGQRARVALARALYADADAYFLDDVLAAVDAHTGAALWEAAILPLAARGKAVVLATHVLQWAADRRVSRVALVERGRVLACAPYAQLLRISRAHEAEAEQSAAAAAAAGPRGGDAAEGAAEGAPTPPADAECHDAIRALLLYAQRPACGPGAQGSAEARGTAPPGGGGADTAVTHAAPGMAPGARPHAAAGTGPVAPACARPPAPAEPAARVEEETALTVRACRRLVRSALHAHEGRAIDRALIDKLAAELGAPPHADGGERRRVGLIARADLGLYLREFGSRLALCVLLVAAAGSAGLGTWSSLWLSTWADSNTACASRHGSEGAHGSGGGDDGGADDPCAAAVQRSALLKYVMIGVGSMLCRAVEMVALTLCSLRASRALHEAMLRRLLGAPMSFFDTHGSGSVLNRFLQDVQSMDSGVPDKLLDTARIVLHMASQLALVLALAPWVACAVPLLAPLYAHIFRAVRLAARDARRLEACAHSPVYGHFSDTLAGRETVRAFGAEARFCAANAALVRDMARALVGNEAVLKWGQALTTKTGCVLYLAAGLACVLLNAAHRLSAAQLGVVLLNAALLQRLAMALMMHLTELETQCVSIERIADFTRLDAEADEDHDSGAHEGARASTPGAAAPPAPADDWLTTPAPAGRRSRGGASLELRAVWLSYGAHRPPALKGLSLRVRAGSKVAVCGASGCGKSSLFAALSRLYPLDRGDVLIDGRSATREMSISAARRAVRVLSQDAALLDGSVRANLRADFSAQAAEAAAAHAPTALARALGLGGRAPFYGRAEHDAAAAAAAEQAAEPELWAALRAARCDGLVRALPSGLDARVKGGDFSEGERQLLALARALLRHPAVLLADEPTSCVDLATDEAVHGALLELDATVLMICHRLQHIGRFDEVVVMDKGAVAEHGPPAALLRDPSSKLAALCARAGLEPEEVLARAAAAGHDRRLDACID